MHNKNVGPNSGSLAACIIFKCYSTVNSLSVVARDFVQVLRTPLIVTKSC